MKLRISAILLAYSVLATNAFAASQDNSWYVGATGDVAFPRSTNVTGTTNGNIKYKFSSGGNMELGFEPQAFNNAMGDVRFEAEGGYHAFGLKDVTAGGVLNTHPKGDLKAETLMANAYYDVHTGTPFTPYIGAGVGDAHIAFDKSNGFGMTSGTSNKLGYQFMTGVSYTPQSMPHTDWTLGYRYLGTSSPEFKTAAGNVKFDAIHAGNIEVGFRYHF